MTTSLALITEGSKGKVKVVTFLSGSCSELQIPLSNVNVVFCSLNIGTRMMLGVVSIFELFQKLSKPPTLCLSLQYKYLFCRLTSIKISLSLHGFHHLFWIWNPKIEKLHLVHLVTPKPKVLNQRCPIRFYTKQKMLETLSTALSRQSRFFDCRHTPRALLTKIILLSQDLLTNIQSVLPWSSSVIARHIMIWH